MIGKKLGKKLARRRNRAIDRITIASTPWDLGASGPANRHGLELEDAADIDPVTGKIINPNAVKRARRVDMLGVWHRKGVITTAGYNAAERLRDAYEATQRAPGWADNDRVQSSPKPDHAVTIQIDRLSAFARIMARVENGDRAIVWHCILEGHAPTTAVINGHKPYAIDNAAGLAHVREALDRLAAAMGS